MKKIICVVGRSGAGKDSFVDRASRKYQIPVLRSYTDRPIRPTEIEGREHKFVTKQKMNKILEKEDILAYTEINNNRYCCTCNQLEDIEDNFVFYVINPEGIKYLQEKHQDKYDLSIISIQSEESIRRKRLNRRGDAKHVINKRFLSEDEQFTIFEENSNNYTYRIDNNSKLDESYEDFAFIIQNILSEPSFSN